MRLVKASATVLSTVFIAWVLIFDSRELLAFPDTMLDLHAYASLVMVAFAYSFLSLGKLLADFTNRSDW